MDKNKQRYLHIKSIKNIVAFGLLDPFSVYDEIKYV